MRLQVTESAVVMCRMSQPEERTVAARILIVEDRPDNRKLMSYLLEHYGHEVLVAETGEAAIEIAQREDFDLILCDIHMPGMDGYEVARQLKADPRCCLTPLVAITALTRPADRDRVLAAGFDGYVAKAIVPQLFIEQVQSFLPVSKLQASEIGSADSRVASDDVETSVTTYSRGQRHG